ncbi:hypothetical protein V8C86DRAFT_2913872 [Haematococcus lacustris]
MDLPPSSRSQPLHSYLDPTHPLDQNHGSHWSPTPARTPRAATHPPTGAQPSPGQPLGLLLLHLTPSTSTFPFTTMLAHAAHQAVATQDLQPSHADPATASHTHTAPTALPVVLIRLPLPPALDGEEEGVAHDQELVASRLLSGPGEAQAPGWVQQPRQNDGGLAPAWSPSMPYPPPTPHTRVTAVQTATSHVLNAEGRSPVPVAWSLQRVLREPGFIPTLLHELGHALHYTLAEQPRGAGPDRDDGESRPGSIRETIREWRGADSALPTVPPPVPPILRSAMLSSCDWREVPSHLAERWGRDPAALMRLSRHHRLGTPLSAADAVRLARLMTNTRQASALELQEQVIACLADQRLHSQLASCSGDVADDADKLAAAGRAAGVWARRAGCAALGAAWPGRIVRSSLQPSDGYEDHGRVETQSKAMSESSFALQPIATLLSLDHLGTSAVVGGAQFAYVVPRLVAAAVWRRHLQEVRHSIVHVMQETRRISICRGIAQAPMDAIAGREVRRLLFVSGVADATPQEAVQKLLGEDALMMWTDGGFIPDLNSDAWQDLDLLG